MFDILAYVKNNIGLSGNNFHDETLNGYIDEVKNFLMDAGASKAVVDSKLAAGVISRGVSDLWNYGSGGASFSPYFFQRATQLIYKEME